MVDPTVPNPQPIAQSEYGWENLARAACVTDEEERKWLPVPRSFIMAVGLRGRYGKRLDLGEDFPLDYPWRHVMKSKLESDSEDDGPWEFDDEVGYENSSYHHEQRQPTQASSPPTLDLKNANYQIDEGGPKETTTIFGLTGIIQHRKRAPEFDELFFASHPHLKGVPTSDDDTPLFDLFWLAHGYIPSATDPNLLFDVLNSETLWTEWRRLDRKEYWHFQLSVLSDGPIKTMALAMGLGLPKILKLQSATAPKAPAHTEWRTRFGEQRSSGQSITANILRSDMYRLAHAVLSLHGHQNSFLFPTACSIGRIFPIARRRKVLQTLLDERVTEIDRASGMALDTALGRLHQYLKHPVTIFSRERVLLCHHLRNELADQRLPTPFDVIVGILSIANINFPRLFKNNGEGSDQQWKISIRPREGVVDFTLEARKTRFFFDLDTVLPSTGSLSEAFTRRQVANSCIHALATLVMHARVVSSHALQSLVYQMKPIIRVSSSTTLPDKVVPFKRKRCALPSESEPSDGGGRLVHWMEWKDWVNVMESSNGSDWSDDGDGADNQSSGSSSTAATQLFLLSESDSLDGKTVSDSVRSVVKRDRGRGQARRAVRGRGDAGNGRGRAREGIRGRRGRDDADNGRREGQGGTRRGIRLLRSVRGRADTRESGNTIRPRWR